jgi:RNA polymerase sigma factor (sigma-70 family)
MWAEIGRLHRDQRAVVVLRYYEDLSIDEIARVLGKPTGTIKSLLHRGLGALKETINDRP